jgi:hypothetical protein
MSSITQIGESRNVVPLLIAIAFFGFIVAVAIASPFYLDAPPFDPILIGP